jgi:hypothetical protein
MHLCRDWPRTRIKQEWNNVHQFSIHRFSVPCNFSYITGLDTRILRISRCCIFNHTIKNKKLWQELFAYFPSVRHATYKNHTFNNYSIVCVFVAPVTFLPSRCLATISDTHIDIQIDGRHLWSTPLRQTQVPWHIYKVSLRPVQTFYSWFGAGEVHWRTVRWYHKPTVFFFSK